MEYVLETRDLTISFGGHIAVNGVNACFPKNQLKSIIGPNGAGKTTFFNLLSGQLKPTKGQVLFKGMDVTHRSPDVRTRLGIGRSFQITNVFPNLTVLENVRLAVQSQAGIRYQLLFHFKKYTQLEERAHQLLQQVMLENKSDSLAKNLTHGEKRKLEIAMLLALDSEVLLLDEPTAGMSLEEVPAIIEVIRRLKAENRTIILIEHKVEMVLDLSDRLMVLFNGQLLADGSPDEILRDERVQAAYLGGLHDAS